MSDLLKPPQGVMRAIFLYVGQGESTLVFMPAGSEHKSMLVDCNRALKLGGIGLPKLLADMPTRKGNRPRLDLFVNTHPHNDHVCGIGDIHTAAHIEELWHSGHRPSNRHEGPYKDLLGVIKAVRDRGGIVDELRGSRSAKSFANGFIDVVAPAQHVCDDIAGEDADTRDRRIHEHCSVLRVRYGNGEMRGVLVTGDSDKCAWKEHITEYHGQPDDSRISASILSASHHGSRTFFKDCEDDPDPYTTHLDSIDPTYVVLSAPDQKDSAHGHPHDDARALYEAKVGPANLLHMGSRKWSFVLDVKADGTYSIYPDRGELATKYGLKDESDPDGGDGSGKRAPVIVIPRVEQSRPMGDW